jgi:hypothetical protein
MLLQIKNFCCPVRETFSFPWLAVDPRPTFDFCGFELFLAAESLINHQKLLDHQQSLKLIPELSRRQRNLHSDIELVIATRLSAMNGVNVATTLVGPMVQTTEERMAGMDHSEVRYFTR